MPDLNQNIQYLKGVGPNRVKLLNKLGINTVYDLITYYPRQYEDRSIPKKIAELEDGEEALIEAIVVSKMTQIRTKRKNMTIYKLIVRDETGCCILTWYNQSYLKTIFKLGNKYTFYGKITKKMGETNMVSPVYDAEGIKKNTGKIIPIYPLTYQLSQNTIRKIIENGLEAVEGKLEETMPEYLIKQNKLISLKDAICKIHFPENFKEFELARNRLVFEELLTMQLLLLNLKNKTTKSKNGIQFDKNVNISNVINTLPFSLTKAQLRVLEEIEKDMESTKNMNRLLQGDVGSRKNNGSNTCSIQSSKKRVSNGNYGTNIYFSYATPRKF